jgi:hypothetical protein
VSTPGITPLTLLAQVENTAAWALPSDPREPPTWQRALREAKSLEAAWQDPEHRLDYLRLLLAAHHATVATFVPTDVDTRIRFHAWQEIRGADVLEAAIAIVDETDAWDPRPVSARVVETEHGALSGHDGEWLAVRAGALGRAIQLGADTLRDRLVDRIDAELEREARAFADVQHRAGAELDALRIATVIAHNLGDLSRVIDDWPSKSQSAKELRERYVRLGHERSERWGATFVVAGAVNKAVMAVENHRFLPLRKARPVRIGRELLLPIGPFFDPWGETVGRDRRLDAEARGAVLAALIDGHEQDPSQQGYLRAMAGMHRTHGGGLDALAREVPARARKLLAGGAVREALRIDRDRFEARMVNRYRAAVR